MKVVIYGTGRAFWLYRDLLFKKYDVIACLDSNSILWTSMVFAERNEILLRADLIIICTTQAYEIVKSELCKQGIDVEKKTLSIVESIGDDVFERWKNELEERNKYISPYM